MAVATAIALFMLPSRESGFKKGLLEWSSLTTFPWDILILLGGGYALAAGFSSTGLSELVGEALKGLNVFPVVIIIGAVCTITTFLTGSYRLFTPSLSHSLTLSLSHKSLWSWLLI